MPSVGLEKWAVGSARAEGLLWAATAQESSLCLSTDCSSSSAAGHLTPGVWGGHTFWLAALDASCAWLGGARSWPIHGLLQALQVSEQGAVSLSSISAEQDMQDLLG